MDVKSLISNKKHNNHHDGEGKGKGESSIRICDLPDSILQLIISFLSTKEAVQTSVLSKRWEYLWRDISRIELTELVPNKRQQFIDFMRRLLLVCDCSNLEKFSLWCEVVDDAFLVNEWLCGFINPKIQELNLDFEGIEEPLVFPDHLFTCATLTKFRLSMQHIFKLPSSILFQNLRTLTLAHIIFPDSSSTQQLFSGGCPSLEELVLVNCNWVNVKAVCISSPALQKLIIRESSEDDDDKSDEDDDIGGQSVSNCCQVVIIGTNLKFFLYEGVLSNDYFLHSSTSVINASIEVYMPDYWWIRDWESDAGYFVFKLLKELPNVEELTISEVALEAISHTVSLLGHVPSFCKLAELHVMVASTVSLSCEALLTILRNSPCLQGFHFYAGGVSLPEDCANNYTLDPVPVCFKKHLKTIKIYSFYGSEEELNAIKILLQAASVLDTLYICCKGPDFDSPMGSKRLKKLYNQIVGFPKGSMDCEIKLEYFWSENGKKRGSVVI